RPGSGTAELQAAPAGRATRAHAGRVAAVGRRHPARSPNPARNPSLAWSRSHRSAQSPSVSDRDVGRRAMPTRGKARKARHDRGAKRGWWRYRPRTDTVTVVSDAVPGFGIRSPG